MAQETAIKFPYQAVVRDSQDHNLWNLKAVNVNVVITENGETMWDENFTGLTTNFNGLLTFNVGEGTPANGNYHLDLIDWSDNVVITSTFTDPNDNNREISVVETPVMAVPYALQAKNAPLTLTTPQIVRYINGVKVGQDNTNDVDSILDAIVANPNGLKKYCKDTVYHYFMNHKNEMRDLALYFIRMVDAQDVNDANAAVSDDVKAEALRLAKEYVMNPDFKDDAKEIVNYYIQHATKQDVVDILDQIKSNHTAFDTVGKFIADTAVKYIKAHPEKVQELVEYYIAQATPTQVDYLLNTLKANENDVYKYLVQKFDTHLRNYLNTHHYLTGICTPDTVEFCDLVERVNTLQNSVKNNCQFSIALDTIHTGSLYNVNLTSKFSVFTDDAISCRLTKQGQNDIIYELNDDDNYLIDQTDAKSAKIILDLSGYPIDPAQFEGYSVKIVRESSANSCSSSESKPL